MKKQRMTKLMKSLQAAGIALTAILSLAACTKDTSLTPDSPEPGKAVALQVDGIVLEKSIETRAAATLATDGASIGIFCSKETGYDAAQVNIPYVYSASASKWAPKTASAPVWLLAGNANVCAYYPYNAAYTNNAAIPLATGVYTAAGDICFAPNRAMNGTPSKSKTLFAMQRAMAMMVFTLKKGDYPGTCKVTGITLANANLPATGTINITAAANTAATVTKANLAYTPLAAAGGADGSVTPTTAGVKTQDVLLVPFALSGNLSVTLGVDGKTMQIDLPAATFTNSKIEAGKRYLLTLKLNGTALDVDNVTIEDWTDVPMTDTGDKDYEPFPEPEPEPIDIGLDFLIAPGNVVATSGGYKFADEQGYYSGVEGADYDPAGGDYFAWNTLDPAATTSTNMSTVWNDADDVCRKIGDGKWYTPTNDQLQKFADLYTAGKAVWGTYEMSSGTKDGMYFGTTTVPDEANQDKYVFLPAAGCRYGTAWNSVGTYSSYWCSTPDSKGAYCLSFDGGSNCDVGYGPYLEFRNNGYSVRCVKDKPLPEHAIAVEGLDFYVADGNVVATLQDDKKTYTYAFAEDQGYYANDNSYFCWNTLEPTGMVDQTSWDADRDPCRQIGDGKWYTPTNDQLQKLEDLYTNKQAIWGTYTMKGVATPVSGMYFGTADVPDEANQDKYVFLPAAGNRSGSSYYGVDTDGSYWSSTPSEPLSYSYSMDFNNNSLMINSDAYNRICANVLRCVRDR